VEVETNGAMTKPSAYGEAPLPKRNGSRGLLPSTWLDRTLRIEYLDADGKAARTSGVFCDWFAFGPVFNLSGGAKTVIS
jgi:hypothetical protein